MHDPVIIRAQLRKALSLAPRRSGGKRSLSEETLKISTERLMGGVTLSVPEFQAALEWNHARNLVEFAWDDDSESNFWELTEKGREKEGLA